MTGFRIRPARPDEYAAVGRLTVESYAADDFVPAEHDYAAVLGNAADRAGTSILLAAVDSAGELLGTVTFCRPGSPEAELSRDGESEFRMLGVAPAARGRGVGEALVRACVELAREHGDTAVVLSTQDVMRAARRLYERLGFTRLPDRDWEPVAGVALIAYRLELTHGPG